jgi:hypothetical protein
MEEPDTTGQPQGFQDIFSLRRPRDAKAGLSSGAKSLGKGLVGGVVGLFAAPIVGATQDGFSGFAKGVATGVRGRVQEALAAAGRAGRAQQCLRPLACLGAAAAALTCM